MRDPYGTLIAAQSDVRRAGDLGQLPQHGLDEGPQLRVVWIDLPHESSLAVLDRPPLGIGPKQRDAMSREIDLEKESDPPSRAVVAQ